MTPGHHAIADLFPELLDGLFVYTKEGAAIGKGNSPQPATQYNTALTQATEKSDEEKALSRNALKALDIAEKGDYTNVRDGGLFLNFADPAMLHRNRELQANAGGQGIYALGEADPNYLATVKANQAAENEQSDAAQYESDIQTGIANAAGYAGDSAKMDLSRKMSVLGTTAGVFNADQQKVKWWQSLLSAGGQVGAAFAGKP